MDPLQALLLALLQGLTEFLPISSSAHLVIPSLVLGWPDQGLAFDVAVHVGTLTAVVIFYRRELLAMAGGCLGLGAPEESAAQRRLVALLALATLPAVLFGFAGDDFIESHLRSLPVIATTTLVFGLLLGLAQWRAPGSSVQLTWRLALLVGLAQGLAITPGISRSGITIAVALLLGIERETAARYSFLLSAPSIIGALLLRTGAAGGEVGLPAMTLGFVAALASGYVCLVLLVHVVKRGHLSWFAPYCLAAGTLALVLARNL